MCDCLIRTDLIRATTWNALLNLMMKSLKATSRLSKLSRSSFRSSASDYVVICSKNVVKLGALYIIPIVTGFFLKCWKDEDINCIVRKLVFMLKQMLSLMLQATMSATSNYLMIIDYNSNH